jgi:hypothetical protein
MTAIRITEAEIIDALASAAAGAMPDDAQTVQDLIATTGYSGERVRMALHAMRAQGRLVVHRVARAGIDGRAAKVPAYTILPAPTPAKRKRA